MKLYLLIFFSICIYASSLLGQNTCEYVKIEFDDIEPVWSHLCQDSTMIGYINNSGFINQDGMEHLGFDGPSFIHEGFLYSLTSSELENDLSGYLIEKVRLTDGHLEWKILTDIRHVDHREYVFNAFVENSHLILFGLRAIGSAFSKFGTQPSYFFIRRYDIESGNLVSYHSPSDTSSSALAMKYRRNYYYNYVEKGLVYNFELIKKFDEGVILIQNVADTLGNMVSKGDTVIIGDFNHLNYRESNFIYISNLDRNEDGTYVFLHDYLPNELSTDPFRSRLTKYDKSFNPLKSIDLTDFDFTPYSLLRVKVFNDDRIILGGCYEPDVNDSSGCKSFYVFFDSDLNYIKTIDVKFNSEVVGLPSFNSEYYTKEDEVLLNQRIFVVPGHSFFQLFKSNKSNTVDLLHTFNIEEEDWVVFIERSFITENGDYLVKATHSCIRGGNKYSWHPEWLLFSEEDFNIMTGNLSLSLETDFMTLQPNPVKNILTLEIKQAFVGNGFIYNMQGNILNQFEVNNQGSKQINVENFPAGIYILKMISKIGKSYELKFIKM